MLAFARDALWPASPTGATSLRSEQPSSATTADLRPLDVALSHTTVSQVTPVQGHKIEGNNGFVDSALVVVME